MKKVVKLIIGSMILISVVFGVSGCSQIVSEDCLLFDNNNYSNEEKDSARWGAGGRYQGGTGGKGTGTSNTATFSGN
ncbi:MAG: hypothetical protein K5829_04280 [Treponema sp.]|nr:hypothetical protein [Treponema sp.]